MPERCRSLDHLANGVIRLTTAALSKERKRLGKGPTTAASNDHARRVLEIAARSKHQIHEKALAENLWPPN